MGACWVRHTVWQGEERREVRTEEPFLRAPFTPAAYPHRDRKASAVGELAGPDLGSVLSLMPVATFSLNKTPAKLCKEWEE